MNSNRPPPQNLQGFAQQLAIAEVKTLFSEPAHLQSLSKVREEFERKLISIETQLEAGVQAQLDEMQNSVTLLNLAKKEMAMVRTNYTAINERCAECLEAIGDFDYILKIRNARVNINEILQQLEIYDAVPKRVHELNLKLDDDHRNLRPVFSEWVHLNAWRERILNEVSNAVTEAGQKEQILNQRVANWEEVDTTGENNWGESSEAHSQILLALGDHFRQVEELGDRVWEIVSSRLRDFFDLAQYEDSALLVVAVEIVERIDRQDERERSRRVSLGENKEKVEMLLPPNQRRKDALKIMETAIEERLDKILPESLAQEQGANRDEEESGESEEEDESGDDEEYEEDEEPVEPPKSKVVPFLQSANQLIVDLRAVSEDVIRCFPESYCVVGLYRWVVEKRLLALLRPVWGTSLISSGDKLRLIGWLDNYIQNVESLDYIVPDAPAKSMSTKSFRKPNSAAGPADERMFDEDYRTAATIRVKEFNRECDNMLSSYISEALPRMNGYMDSILSRNSEPETNADGNMQTSIPEDLFHALTQELAVVHSHGVNGKYMGAFVQKAILKTISSYQESQTEKIKNREVEFPIECCCALMNDYERMYDLCDGSLMIEVKNCIGPITTNKLETLLSDVQEDLDKVAVGFLKGVEAGTERIVHEIFKELETNGVISSLFTDSWVSGASKGAATLRVTFEDYFDDPECGLRIWFASELVLGRTIALVFTRLIKTYVHQFMSRTEPFKNKPRAVFRLREDGKEFQTCFVQYLDLLRFGKIRTNQAFTEKLEIIFRLAHVLEDAFPQNHFEDIAHDFGPYSQHAIARVLFFRGDLTPQEREDLRMYSDVDTTAGTGRFDLSDLPPLHDTAMSGLSSPTGGSKFAPKSSSPSTTKKKKKKKKKKKHVPGLPPRPATRGAKPSGRTVEMSLDAFVGDASAGGF